MSTLVVMAKQCVPGRVKTRLHPPYSLAEAARIAAASLDDTLTAANSWDIDRRILCFAGDDPPTTAARWEVVPQAAGTLDLRIGDVLDRCTGPTLLIGMDTPQVRAEHIPPAAWFRRPGAVDAWLGMAADGGYWAMGLAAPRGGLVRGVPMSRPDTGAHQRRCLERAGLRVADLPVLVDVDDASSLRVVCDEAPNSATARTVTEIGTPIGAGTSR